MIDLRREGGATDERLPTQSAGALARVEGQITASEHSARYLWATQLVGGRDVLDAGCGAGQGSGILADAGARHVVGVDSAPGSIGQAEGSIEGPTDFVLAELAALPFTDGSFDVVVCFDVVEQATDRSAIVSELRRVLRPDGHLLISLARPSSADPPTTDSSTERLLAGLFADVGLYAQHGCLGCIVRPIDRPDGATDGQMRTLTRRLGRDDPSETGLLAVASVGSRAPRLEPTAVVSSLVGLRRSSQPVGRTVGELNGLPPGVCIPAAGGLAAGVPGGSASEARLAALTRRLAEAETENARIPELERSLLECGRAVVEFESSVLGRIARAILHVRSVLRHW